jgi:hypothetical protein
MTSSGKQPTVRVEPTVYERQLDLALASIHACATRHSTTSYSVEARPADAGSRGWRERLQARRSEQNAGERSST